MNFHVGNSSSRLQKSLSKHRLRKLGCGFKTSWQYPSSLLSEVAAPVPFPTPSFCCYTCAWQGLRSWHSISISSTWSSSKEELSDDDLLKLAHHFLQNVLRNVVLENLLLGWRTIYLLARLVETHPMFWSKLAFPHGQQEKTPENFFLFKDKENHIMFTIQGHMSTLPASSSHKRNKQFHKMALACKQATDHRPAKLIC